MTSSLSFDVIKEFALNLGFHDVGVTEASISEEDSLSFFEYLKEERHGLLKYMENDIRVLPQKLLEGAKTALLFVTYYKQEKVPFKEGFGVVSSYARGKDYHHLHRKRLLKIAQFIEEKTGQKNSTKPFSDSSPILEKALFVQAGLGWFGKNTLLIHRKYGTFILLSGLLTTLDFSFTLKPLREKRCGSCTKCLDACPTQALISPYQIDAKKCLSYHLIESKEDLPLDIIKKNPGYIFGCDICQDVCPHNATKKPSSEMTFHPSSGIGPYIGKEELAFLEKNPEKLFGTPLQRRKVEGLKKNFHSLSCCK